jgi:hypothetical protein
MTRGIAVRGTAGYRGKTAVPVLHAAVPPRFRFPEFTAINEEPLGTAEYLGIGSKTWLRFGTGRSMVCISFARDGVGTNFYAPCHFLVGRLTLRDLSVNRPISTLARNTVPSDGRHEALALLYDRSTVRSLCHFIFAFITSVQQAVRV